MRRTRAAIVLGLTLALSAAALAISLPDAGAGDRNSQSHDVARVRPVIFVHGFSGSGAQFESQALRFTSNGYAPQSIAVHEYDSTFATESAQNVFTRLDQRIAQLLAATKADKVDLLAHSLGTSLMQQYLNSSPARAAKVAHYVNLDGAPAAAPPGAVPTLAIWGRGSTACRITGAANIYFTRQTHVQVVTSPETFRQMYAFFTGKEPATTDVVPQRSDHLQLAGRALIFPQNTGVPNGTLQIYEVSGATGARVDPQPDATFPLHGDGSWGPFNARAGRDYEFAIVRAGVPTHHLYYEPFVRNDFWIRLLTSPPTGGIGDLIQKSPGHAALTIVRYKEFWGDQGADNDTLEINGVNVLNPADSPISKLVNAVFVFDAGSDSVSHLGAPLPTFFALPFITGVDDFVPAATPIDDTISIASTPRLGGGRVEVVNVPNWASSTDTVTVQFDDAIRR